MPCEDGMNKVFPLFLFLCFTACGDRPVPLVGVILPLSGGFSADGAGALSGLRALEGELGENPSCRFVVMDNFSNPRESVRCVTELYEEGCSLIVGPAYSSSSIAASRRAKELNIPILSPSATHPSVTQDNPWSFRACFLDTQQAEALAKFSVSTLGANHAALIVNLSEPYSLDLARGFAESFVRFGGNLAGRFYYYSEEKDFQDLVEAVAASHPDVIMIPGYAPDIRPLLEAAYPAWNGIPLLGSDGWDSPDLLADPIQVPNSIEAYISNHFSDSDASLPVRTFVTQFMRLYPGQRPTQLSALTYDAAQLAVKALAQSLDARDPLACRDALARLSPLGGVTGEIEMALDGDVKKSLVLQKFMVKNGQASLNFQERIEPR
jgi:branched-chain amino acid transport system substrate-binding protein